MGLGNLELLPFSDHLGANPLRILEVGRYFQRGVVRRKSTAPWSKANVPVRFPGGDSGFYLLDAGAWRFAREVWSV